MFRLLQSGFGVALSLCAASLFGQQPTTDDLVRESRLHGFTRKASDLDDFGTTSRPRWTPFKVKLRDWIESRLPSDLSQLNSTFPNLELTLTAELQRAGLVGPGATIDAVKLFRPNEFPDALIVKAGVTVPCGVDTSIYVYSLHGSGRVRLLTADGASKDGNDLDDVRFSNPDASGTRLLYASWSGVQCASVWNGLDYRLYRIGPGADRAELVSSANHSFNIDGDVHVKLTTKELLLELTAEAMEAGWRRTYVLHYIVDGDHVTRVDPVALQPQDFTHEWLIQPWAEMESRSASTVGKWHDRLHSDLVFADYEFVQPCSQREGFTQVAVEFDKITHELSEPGTVYFLVKSMGQYSYQMSDVSVDRQSGCPGETEVDLMKQPSLFGKQ